MSFIINQNQSSENVKVHINNELDEYATLSNNKLLEAKKKIQELSEQIPCLNLDAKYTSHSLFQKCARLIHKIHSTSLLKIKLLEEFLSKPADEKYYLACILNIEKTIKTQEQDIELFREDINDIQKEENTSSNKLDVKAAHLILTTMQCGIETIEGGRLLTHSIQNYAAVVNYQNSLSSKVVQATSAISLQMSSSLNWIVQKSSSFLGIPTTYFGPSLSPLRINLLHVIFGPFLLGSQLYF